MINTQRVAVFNTIEQLLEGLLDKFIFAEIPAPADLGEEVTVFTIIHNDVGEIIVLDDAAEGNEVGVSGGEHVETDLMQVQLASAGRSRRIGVVETFHGVGDGGGGSSVECSINGAITTPTEQLCELQRTAVDAGTGGGRGQGNVSCGHGKGRVR